MANANVALGVKGIDKTGAAFNSVKTRAKATGASIRSYMAGALAAAGSYMGFRSIINGINELGKLSDLAMKTGTSAEELTKMSTALNILGIQANSVGQISRAFDYMRRTTGRSGMEGFFETVEEIAKLPDAAERSKEAMKKFGRMGMEFVPLIEAAREGTGNIRELMGAMPGISQSAADAGDGAADAMTLASAEIKRVWLGAIGYIAGLVDEELGGNIRASLTLIVVWCENKLKSFCSNIAHAFAAAGMFIEGTMNTVYEFFTGGDASGAWDTMMSNIENDMANTLEDIGKYEDEYQKRKEQLLKLQANYDAVSSKMGKRTNGDAAKEAADLLRSPQIRNALITSQNEANRIAAQGPQVSESKKQTKLQEQIAEATERTADAIESMDNDGETMKELT